MISAGAADCKHDLAFPLFYIKRIQKIKQVYQLVQKLLGLCKRKNIIRNFFIQPRFIAQIFNPVRIGKTAHIYNKIRLVGDAHA